MKKYILVPSLILLISLQACTQEKKPNRSEKDVKLQLAEDFGNYWYQGKAELNAYELTQVRYGQKRSGEAVLIFVTEDFSRKKQVKLDNPQAQAGDVQKVLKLNFTKKFDTGVYPYSIMSSIFSPIYPKKDIHAEKITTSVQEWCGHVFMQLNKERESYDASVRSYFESEGDKNFTLPKAWLEDEMWNLIRLDPSAIPTGSVEMIPATMFLRLKHQPTKIYEATIEKSIQGDSSSLIIKYPELKRTVEITYSNESPHTISGWKEAYPEGGALMTTTGMLKKRLMLDYWNKNSVADSTYRVMLGINN